MSANGKLIYKNAQMEKHVAIHTMHKIYTSIWIKIMLQKQWSHKFYYYCRKLSSYGCDTDRLVELILVLLLAIDAQQMDLLMHMDTVNSCCYCLL